MRSSILSPSLPVPFKQRLLPDKNCSSAWKNPKEKRYKQGCGHCPRSSYVDEASVIGLSEVIDPVTHSCLRQRSRPGYPKKWIPGAHMMERRCASTARHWQTSERMRLPVEDGSIKKAMTDGSLTGKPVTQHDISSNRI